MKDRRPLIVDVKRGSLDDGPGIRSVVFFKGCPLGCIFCQNIETQEPEAEIAFRARRCIRCGSCADACPEEAIDLRHPGRIYRDRCNRCGKCAEVCPGHGLSLIGRYYSVGELVELLLRDSAFYRHSGGGVTMSGGECTLYPDYLESVLRLLKTREIHIVLETTGYFNYEVFREKIIPYVDIIYYDIKLVDRQSHIQYTGKPNDKILDNLHRLISEARVEVHPRVPLVPGITATRENLSAIVDFLSRSGARSVSLLPYNPMGFDMAECLGKPVPPLPKKFMKHDEEKEIYAEFRTILKERRQSMTLESRVGRDAILDGDKVEQLSLL